MTNEIRFWRADDPYGEFSNFAPIRVFLKDKIWPTSEHYYQAQKYAGTEREEAIRRANSPLIAANMGRSRQHPMRSDWESVKEDVMREVLLAKFTQHEEPRDLLLSTGDATIIEASPKDRYWGDGADGSGLNRLGVLLMEVREHIRAEYQ